jgi:pilus assembly protein CpaE
VIRSLTVGLIVSDPDFRETLAASFRSLAVQVAFAVSDPAAEVNKLANTNPDVLVLDFGRPGAVALMAELQRAPNAPAVIAAHQNGDPNLILTALRAGAREFVYSPVNERALADVLDKIAAERMLQDARRHKSITVGFISASGGCGATVLACHVAAELRRILPVDVLAADFDVAAGLLGFWMRASGTYSVLDAAQNLDRLDLSLWKGIVNTVQPRLDVLRAPGEAPISELPGPRRFVEVLRFARAGYHWVIVDLGIGLGSMQVQLLPELDTVCLVSTADVTSLYHAKRILRRLDEFEISRERRKIVITRTRKDAPPDLQDLEKLLGAPVDIVLPDDPREITDAHADNRLVSRKSDLGKRMSQLAARFAGKEEEPPKPSKFSLFRFRAEAT